MTFLNNQSVLRRASKFSSNAESEKSMAQIEHIEDVM